MRAEIFERLRTSLEAEETVVLATVVAGPGTGSQLLLWPDGRSLGDLGSPALDERAAGAAREALRDFAARRERFDESGETVEVFFDVHPPPPKLVIVGAVHVAVHLIDFARSLGFRSVVIDPRTAFATPERFARADRLIAEWPADALAQVPLNEATYFAVLSHDLKIDLPALEIALRSPARYIGALGSKKTHAKRVDALREKGFADDEIGRIRAPIGVDLGGRRAEEIALSIMAQVVAASHGRAI